MHDSEHMEVSLAIVDVLITCSYEVTSNDSQSRPPLFFIWVKFCPVSAPCGTGYVILYDGLIPLIDLCTASLF